jgi:hypothetical protein
MKMEGTAMAVDVEDVAELLIVEPRKKSPSRDVWRKSGSIPCERINLGFSPLFI